MESKKRILIADADVVFRDALIEAFVALQTSCEKFSYNLQKRNGA